MSGILIHMLCLLVFLTLGTGCATDKPIGGAAHAAQDESRTDSATINEDTPRESSDEPRMYPIEAPEHASSDAPNVGSGDARSPATATGNSPEVTHETKDVDEQADASGLVSVFEHIRADLENRVVELDGVVCLDAGWLEQLVCSPGTREHESLVVSPARPSNIHAALLLAGYEPGRPGQWIYEGGEVRVRPPEGDVVRVFVRYEDENGETIEHPLDGWVRDHLGRRKFPDDPFVFGGSRIARNPDFMGEGEHYVADMSGSIIGLVTFGDEVIGWSNVLADQVDVQPAEWEVDTDRIPPMGTEVTIILRPGES